MKEIPLTRGYVAIVDDEDFGELSKFKWCAHGSQKIYAVRREGSARRFGSRVILMHRQIALALDGVSVDHINGDGLDNRKENLRLCIHQQNQCNLIKRRGNLSSRYKGVCKMKNGKWMAYIGGGSTTKRLHLGCFPSEAAAAEAYDTKAKEIYGEFARLNFPG